MTEVKRVQTDVVKHIPDVEKGWNVEESVAFMQSNYSRSRHLGRHRKEADEKVVSVKPKMMLKLAAQLADVVADHNAASGHGAGAPTDLELISFHERWARTAGTPGAGVAAALAGMQLEGLAPRDLRGPLEALTQSLSDDWGLEIGLESVEWYEGIWQGALHTMRRANGHTMLEQMVAEMTMHFQSKLARSVSSFVAEMEIFFGGRMAALEPPPIPQATLDAHDWQRGRHTVSGAAPRLEIYPHFCSAAECAHMIRYGLKFLRPVSDDDKGARCILGKG